MFEGFSSNTPARGPREARSRGIGVSIGYDARVDGARLSLMMAEYGTGGTPWTIIIDRQGIVRFNDFTPGDIDQLARRIERLRAR